MKVKVINPLIWRPNVGDVFQWRFPNQDWSAPCLRIRDIERPGDAYYYTGLDGVPGTVRLKYAESDVSTNAMFRRLTPVNVDGGVIDMSAETIHDSERASKGVS